MHARLLATTLLAAALPLPAIAAPLDLNPSSEGRSFAVQVKLEVGGDLEVEHVRPAAGAGIESGKTKTLPMSVHGDLAYEERPAGGELFVRRYSRAEAVIKIEQGGAKPSLPASRRTVLADASGPRVVLYCPNGPLTRDQLDLIDVTGATPAIDEVLPGRRVEDGESWDVPSAAIGKLLGLDSVGVCEVSCVVDEVKSQYARFQMAGAVHGELDGAATEYDLRGIGLYDRRQRAVTQLNLAMKEKRTRGPATPGFVGVAKVNITRKPLAERASLDADALQAARAAQGASRDLHLNADQKGFEVSLDRNWFVVGRTNDTLSLRRVVGAALVAQTTFTRLPERSAERQLTLDGFERDVRLAMSKSGGQIASSEQWTTSAGNRCMGVVARGAVEGVPIEWRHYLVAPEGDGHCVSLTTTLAQQDAKTLAAADRELADTLRLVAGGEAPGVASRDEGVNKR